MYIFRDVEGKKTWHVLANDFTVRRIEKNRVKRTVNVGGLGFREIEGTGTFEANLLRVSVDAVDYTGRKRRVWDRVGRSAAAVKTVVRIVRPQEQARINAQLEEIDACKQAVTEAQRELKDILAEAWSKGNVVRLADVEGRLPS